MKHYQCKCGEYELWSTMGPIACQSCEKCGTNALGEEPKPHTWSTTQVKTDEGRKPYTYCVLCGISKRKFEQGDE